MISSLWLAYTLSRSVAPLVATSALLVAAGFAGTALFVRDFLRKRRPLSREEVGFLFLISFAVLLALSSAFSLPFTAQGDPYAYYVPIGRYLNQYPGAYVDSAYRFSLSRNFASYALYAHADLLGGSFASYLLLPIPFLLGTIFGVISVSRRLTHQNRVALIAATCYVFSVYFGLILKFNMFYLGNLLMSTFALFYCYLLLADLSRVIAKLAPPLSTFAMLLFYDYTILLLVPLALGYLALRKPRLVFYIAAGLALPLLIMISQQNVTLEFLQFPQLDFQSSIAFLGLLLIVLAGVKGKAVGPAGPLPMSYPLILTYVAAAGSLLLQRIVNLVTYGFMTVANYTLSSTVLAYIQRTGWFYQTRPDILNTVSSIFFSDVFFGWGLFFTACWLFMNRGRPMTTFFLTLVPLTILVETVNNDYLRLASFLAPLIVVFLAAGVYTLVRRTAVLVAVSLSFLALLLKAFTTLPNLDYEHRAIANPVYMGLFVATLFSAALFYGLTRYRGGQLIASGCAGRVRTFSGRLRSMPTRVPFLGSIGWRRATSLAIIALCISLSSYNVLVNKYSAELYPADARLVDEQILPLIQDRTTVLTIELVHADFNFYKDVVIIPMAQPWVLESFLRLHLANTTNLVTWLTSNGISYMFLDRSLTSGNQDVFGLFDQLSTSCRAFSQCSPLFDDGRFVLLQISR